MSLNKITISGLTPPLLLGGGGSYPIINKIYSSRAAPRLFDYLFINNQRRSRTKNRYPGGEDLIEILIIIYYPLYPPIKGATRSRAHFWSPLWSISLLHFSLPTAPLRTGQGPCSGMKSLNNPRVRTLR